MTLINKKENIFNDNIAFVEQWDFSKANLNEENRIHAITLIASVCYQNPKALNSDSLYNRLMAESMGLPSSSFEFVPVLLNYYEGDLNIFEDTGIDLDCTNIIKYGQWIVHNNDTYLLTNFRAIIYDKEKYGVDLTKHFNTEEECKIIEQHFKVFKYKVDIPTRGQMVRHRSSWQELSRRYVSGKKKEFEFYISDKMKNINTLNVVADTVESLNTDDIIQLCLTQYNEAISQGIKPEEARRILPQSCYTEIWGAWQPSYLDNFYKLRLDKHAQKEIRIVAEAMKELEENK